MSNATTDTRTFLRQPTAFPFCEGCGYRPYVEHLDRALVELDLDPSNVLIVSDVGCVGGVDAMFDSPHTVHTTYGRSTAFATGIELADAILHDSQVKTIVVVGDGGAMAGLQHILNAALLNVDVTVLVANNLRLGLSGGQPSGFRAAGAGLETAAPLGPVLDFCALVQQCGGTFVARMPATDERLSNVFARAIGHPGFALVEVLVDCPAYQGSCDRADAVGVAGERDARLALGCLIESRGRPDFGSVYRQKLAEAVPADEAAEAPLPLLGSTPVRRSVRWVIAGSAGQFVHRAANILAKAAAMTGSHVTQNDPPSTLSCAMSEVCVSRDEIGFPGVDSPDVAIAVSEDGLEELRATGTLANATRDCTLLLEESLPAVVTPATTLRGPFRALCTPARAAMTAILVANRRLQLIPERAMSAAIQLAQPDELPLYERDLSRLVASLHP